MQNGVVLRLRVGVFDSYDLYIVGTNRSNTAMKNIATYVKGGASGARCRICDRTPRTKLDSRGFCDVCYETVKRQTGVDLRKRPDDGRSQNNDA